MDGIVKLDFQENVPKSTVKSTLFKKEIKPISTFFNYLRYKKSQGPIQIYFPLCNIRIPSEGLLLNVVAMPRTHHPLCSR